MLFFLVVSIVLQLTDAKEFFDDCPISKEQRIDNDRVFDILSAFYKDLCFVQASTQSADDGNFEGVVEEIRNVVPTDPRLQWVRYGLELYGLGYIDEADHILNDADLTTPRAIFPPIASYIHYFAAEDLRMDGYVWQALQIITATSHGRSNSVGVSLNELEKLYGLTVIQRVWNFNKDVDEVHVISRSPSFALLQQVHEDFRDDIDPLREMRPAELRRIMGSNSRINPALRRREIGEFRPNYTPSTAVPELLDQLEVNPVPDIFKVRSISKTSAEGILCEFTRKLAILVPNSREDGGTDYSSLINQLRKLDARSAEQIETIVIPNLADEIQRGVAEDHLILLNNRNSSPNLSDDLFITLQTYVNYFRAELIRYENNCDDILIAGKLVDKMKKIRLTRRGVSLDKMYELEGRILTRTMKCFHDRLISIYRLNGRESDQEIKEKRSRFGGWMSHFPNP